MKKMWRIQGSVIQALKKPIICNNVDKLGGHYEISHTHENNKYLAHLFKKVSFVEGGRL